MLILHDGAKIVFFEHTAAEYLDILTKFHAFPII